MHSFTIPHVLGPAGDGNICADMIHDSASFQKQPYPGRNTVFVFAGRWRFLNIQFPYLFANLRINGGVIDRIMYMMVRYDSITHDNLLDLTNVVNTKLQQEVVTLNYMGYTPRQPPSSPFFAEAYYDIIQDILRNPSNRYFKVDDDVIYIQPGTFENMISRNNNTSCTIRFANIAGANWRCSYIHQSMGLYNNKIINPIGLTFDYNIHAECGWKSLQCAQLSLDTFLSLYKGGQLDRYFFNGTILLEDKWRFSINFFMIDNDAIDCKALGKSWPIHYDDEYWWTVQYARQTNPHCIVGNSLVVHFSYFTTVNALLNSTLIEKFETIAHKEHTDIPDEVRTVLSRILKHRL